MSPYFMTFHVKGELVGSMLLREPEQKLLIDVSPNPSTGASAPGFAHPERVCFTLKNPDLIKRFRDETSPGDVIEATGTFAQSGYIPHKTSYIDTTFLLLDFNCRAQSWPELFHAGRKYSLPEMVWMH
ncbi:hypothetical protein [Shimia abyssi]|uniref:Uncharacterized protein n=1 Tax=Shimia abyssi TaxID=1662395 RepID=A0A2P8FD87_9RHOB|nr:hypothetical protein [Shimia abyssi]PSL19696.1 hypothetical protein CLV88_105119 [Shimia abyssi]